VTTGLQISVDCTDPHLLARFWAAALGYEVEDHADLVERMLQAGHATSDDTVVVDGRLAWREAAACADPSGGRPRLLFQTVPEPKVVKNRVHLDLHVGPDQRDAEVERLVGLGARRIGEGRQGPQSWVVLADPEGNELCVA
jgi:hypothetical protein